MLEQRFRIEAPDLRSLRLDFSLEATHKLGIQIRDCGAWQEFGSDVPLRAGQEQPCQLGARQRFAFLSNPDLSHALRRHVRRHAAGNAYDQQASLGLDIN